MEVIYDYVTISEVISHDRIAKGPLSIWRYEDLLPASAEDPVDIMSGYTPLMKAKNLGKRLGLNNLYIKNDSVNPSFSFKDRVVSVAATKAVEFGYETLGLRQHRQPGMQRGGPRGAGGHRRGGVHSRGPGARAR